MIELLAGLPAGGSAAPVELPIWAGPTFTLIGVVITALGLVINNLIRKPTQVTDLWAENRNLRSEVNQIREAVDKLLRERDTQRTYNRAFADGFDAQSRIIERMIGETGVHPKYGPGEHEAIERARALRAAVETDDEEHDTH